MSKRLLSVRSLLTLTVACSAGTAFAAETYRYNVRGNGAEAGFSSYDDCSYTDAWVYFSEEAARGNDAWSGQWGQFYVNTYDWCTGQSAYFVGDLATADFTGNGAQGAELMAEGVGFLQQVSCSWVEPVCTRDRRGRIISCTEGTYDCQWASSDVPFSVDLSWAPTDVARGNSTQVYQGKGYVAHSHRVGEEGYGPVAGTVSYGKVDLSNALYSWGRT